LLSANVVNRLPRDEFFPNIIHDW